KNLAKRCGASEDACKAKRTATCNTAALSAKNQGRTYRSSAVQDCLDKIDAVFHDGASAVTPDGEKEVTKVC
ncbi:hypothetical protein, partial [Escherichia coli]|uniref:hypothetical protein n=1 Tax=Escherichia coli TaxID=562 RepID=UPI00159B89A1